MIQAGQGNAARACPSFVSLLLPFIFLQPLPEDHWTALISLADMAANLFGLLEGQPVGRRIPCGTEHPDVNASVGFLTEQVPWKPSCTVPGFVPWDGALLEFYDDSLSDEVIDGRHWYVLLSACEMCCCVQQLLYARFPMDEGEQ